MRSYPEENCEWEQEDLKRLNAEDWQVELLKVNPSYSFWGPHEDYMWKKGDGWDCPLIYDSWQDMNIELDDLNEVVNFYFQIQRESDSCPVCGGPKGGNGIHPDSQWVSESFYRHSSPFKKRTAQEIAVAEGMATMFGSPADKPIIEPGSFPSEELFEKYGYEFRKFCEEMHDGDGCWKDKITQDELDALIEAGRFRLVEQEDGKVITLEEVNFSNSSDAKGPRSFSFNHDAINMRILVEQRCRRLGLPHYCTECEGYGYIFTAPKAHVNLVLWLLHPRKGASRGVEVKNIQQGELSEVFEFLSEAANRNADRFSKVPIPTKA